MLSFVRRHWGWVTFGVLLLVVAGVSFYMDRILRDTIEGNMNRRLQGYYTAHVGAVSFHPIGFSLDLLDTTIAQNEHPDPPVLRLPRLHASVHWRELVRLRLVGDFLLDRPKIYLNMTQAKTEIKDPRPVDQRGWQDALQEAYPLKINLFRVRNADITYVDRGPYKPLHLSRLNVWADNIRNVSSPDRVYPSDLHLDGVVFDKGKLVVNGNADFLAKPHPGVKAVFSLDGVPLDYLKPVTDRYNVVVRKGTFSSFGNFEYAAKIQTVDLQDITLRDLDIEYAHTPQTAAAEEQTAKEVQKAAKKASNNPELLLRVDKVDILKSSFAYLNQTANPPYRVFLAETDIHLNNLSNQGAEGKATGTLQGKFMGSGVTKVDLTFQPKGKKPDFDVRIAIDGTQLRDMNDLLRAYANFNVSGGEFSLYSELGVHQGRINGYVKPLFKNIQVSATARDEQQGVLHSMYLGAVRALSWMLKNRPREEVATVVTVSGTLDTPQTSTWETVAGLVQNAFFKAILPGFEREARAAAERAKSAAAPAEGKKGS